MLVASRQSAASSVPPSTCGAADERSRMPGMEQERWAKETAKHRSFARSTPNDLKFPQALNPLRCTPAVLPLCQGTLSIRIASIFVKDNAKEQHNKACTEARVQHLPLSQHYKTPCMQPSHKAIIHAHRRLRIRTLSPNPPSRSQCDSTRSYHLHYPYPS